MGSKTVSHLMKDHHQIERVLGSFENYLAGVASSADADRMQLWPLIDYLTEILFLKHEEKEETVLLPELARHGLSWSDGSLAHVRREHRHGRYLMRSIRQSAHQAKDWSSDDRRHFVSIANEWVSFLRQHMAQEETRLFPYVDTELSPEQDQMVAEQFERIDRDFNEMPDAQSLRSTGEAFVARYQTRS